MRIGFGVVRWDRVASNVIAFFIQDLRAGGAERNVARVVNGIAARGIEVDLVVVHRTGPFFDELDRRVNVFELPQARTVTSVLGLKRYIESRRPVALLSSLTHTNVAAILANLAARPKTTLAVIERNEISLNRQVKTGLVRVAYGLVPWLYPRADILAAVSGGVRDDLARTLRITPDRINVLYNPVVSDDIVNRSLSPVSHPWLDGHDIPVILGVGRLEPQKNFPLLIRAVSLVLRQRPVRLIVLGEGVLRADLEQLAQSLGISGQVSFPGFDSNPFRYMRRSSVYVLSSNWEGLPTTLIEAMACGAPVVATDCRSGPREILRNGKLGRLVPVDDVEALARAIVETLDSPGDERARIARAHEFNLESAVDRYLSVIGWSH
jgi:glycosyltransferase involved in cell wall biosynthesis